MTLPLVYIAAPYASDPVANTRRAIKEGMNLYLLGVAVPLIPHTSLILDLVCPMPAEDWYAYDLHLLERCDAVWRLPGESTGADAEMVHALERDIPVFGERDALLAWAREWKPADLEARLSDASHRAVTAIEEARVATGVLRKLAADGARTAPRASHGDSGPVLVCPFDVRIEEPVEIDLTDAEAALFDTIAKETTNGS